MITEYMVSLFYFILVFTFISLNSSKYFDVENDTIINLFMYCNNTNHFFLFIFQFIICVHFYKDSHLLYTYGF